jgi:hypothetical protein
VRATGIHILPKAHGTGRLGEEYASIAGTIRRAAALTPHFFSIE